MSDFFHPVTTQVCRKAQRCIYCGESIEAGQHYLKQSGVWDGEWFTSHYHPECFSALSESGEDEFSPYSNERPSAQAVQPCGGCGESDPDKRCIGCMHPFNVTPGGNDVRPLA